VPPAPNLENPGDDPYWWIERNDYYARGFGGNSVAEHDGDSLVQWNVPAPMGKSSIYNNIKILRLSDVSELLGMTHFPF